MFVVKSVWLWLIVCVFVVCVGLFYWCNLLCVGEGVCLLSSQTAVC